MHKPGLIPFLILIFLCIIILLFILEIWPIIKPIMSLLNGDWILSYAILGSLLIGIYSFIMLLVRLIKKKGEILFYLFSSILVIIVLTILLIISRGPQPARNARIQASLSQYRSVAEMIKAAEGNYDNVCNESSGSYLTGKTSLMDDIRKNKGTITCNDSTSSYCISATLPSPPNTWCVDSTGNSTPSSCGSATECQ